MKSRQTNVFFSTLILFIFSAGCSGPGDSQQPPLPGPPVEPRSPCVDPAPPAPGQVDGLQQYTGGPGEAVFTSIQDLDGDGQRDLLVSGKGYTSATGNVATALYLSQGKCGRYGGAFWRHSGSGIEAAAGRHHGLPVLQVSTQMTFKEFQTRYCFDGSVYVPLARRVRHFYDHQKKKLRHLLTEAHWEPWEASADDSCRPLKASTGAVKQNAPRAKRRSAPLRATVASGPAKMEHPAVGSKLRRAILHTLRQVMEQELKQKVVFKIGRRNFKVIGDWAMVHASPIQPNGKPVDYSITSYQKEIDDGTFDEGIHALLRLHNGTWAVVVHEVGCTDICWGGWDKKHQAPAALFKL